MELKGEARKGRPKEADPLNTGRGLQDKVLWVECTLIPHSVPFSGPAQRVAVTTRLTTRPEPAPHSVLRGWSSPAHWLAHCSAQVPGVPDTTQHAVNGKESCDSVMVFGHMPTWRAPISSYSDINLVLLWRWYPYNRCDQSLYRLALTLRNLRGPDSISAKALQTELSLPRRNSAWGQQLHPISAELHPALPDGLSCRSPTSLARAHSHVS